MSQYTPEIIQAMRDQAPLNLQKAEALASEYGLPTRGIIGKALREGIAYEKAAPAAKKPKGETKATIVADIESALPDIAHRLTGLDKAPLLALQALRDYLTTIVVE